MYLIFIYFLILFIYSSTYLFSENYMRLVTLFFKFAIKYFPFLNLHDFYLFYFILLCYKFQAHISWIFL